MPDAVSVVAISQGGLLSQAARSLEPIVGRGAARREARRLWAAVSGVTPGEAWLEADRSPGRAVAARFEAAVRRRVKGEPFAYAARRASFRTLDLHIDRRALIPRPETEGLVDLALGWTGRPRQAPGGAAADLGTGSGCIALSLAVEGRFERVVAVERAPGAAALARENVCQVGPPIPVDVREGNWLEPLAGERFRIIVANPPYLTLDEYDALDALVRDYEPREALVSGPEGLEATRHILATAAPLLEPGGALLLEVDERRAALVRRLAADAGWGETVIYEDLFGRPRYAVVIPSDQSDHG